MTFDRAMAEFDRLNPVGTIADTFPITLGGEASSRPAEASPGFGTADGRPPAGDRPGEGHVNIRTAQKNKRWTHVRVPVALHERLERLARKMEADYAAGRVSVPTEMCERIPAWFVIAAALDEQECRRERSRRPRRKLS